MWHDVNYVENEVLDITGKTLRGIIIENMPPPKKKKISCFIQIYTYFEKYNKDIDSFSFTFSRTI